MTLHGQTLAEALDAPLLIWTGDGDGDWVGQSVTSHDGFDAAESPPLADFQLAGLLTTVTGPGTLSFWWKTSSEAIFDYLAFELNGEEIPEASRISGDQDWIQVLLDLPNGEHELGWYYAKDESFSVGLDRAWVDEVSFVPPSGPQTLSVIPTSGGTVTKNPDQSDYSLGQAVTLTAAPYPGYSFVGWH